MSGGVDSSVVAGLLAEAGEDLVGVFMRNGVTGAGGARSCCSVSDARDARGVADRWGIPFYVHEMSKPFAELMDAFARDYAAGLTPNPCVVCNNDLKFGVLAELADDLGCETVATGHYARLEQGQLRRGLDRGKDQSYLLAGLTRDQLGRARFPLGALSKRHVRAEARRLGLLTVADKRDSADICFVPGGDYRAVVAERLGDNGMPGDVVDGDGQVLARHAGIGGFTVGQRRGLGVALGEPAYVTAIDPERGEVLIGTRRDLARHGCRVEQLNWLSVPAWGEPVGVQLRHHHEPESAVLHPEATGAGSVASQVTGVEVRFERPSEAVTPGQYAVFYRGDQVLGAGRIAREPQA